MKNSIAIAFITAASAVKSSFNVDINLVEFETIELVPGNIGMTGAYG